MPSARPSDACALCGAPQDPAHKPFCGRGCRDRDLLNWLGEGYRVPFRPIPGERPDGLDNDDDQPL